MLEYFKHRFMGSFVEINDTLQITKAQGFPEELNLEKHKQHPFSAADFKDRIFEFKNKKGIRNYKQPPVRNFLAENIDDRWLYWGLIHITEIEHDYVNGTTSGKYKIIKIYTPEEMDQAYDLIDMRPEAKFPIN